VLTPTLVSRGNSSLCLTNSSGSWAGVRCIHDIGTLLCESGSGCGVPGAGVLLSSSSIGILGDGGGASVHGGSFGRGFVGSVGIPSGFKGCVGASVALVLVLMAVAVLALMMVMVSVFLSLLSVTLLFVLVPVLKSNKVNL
jgi:hypothetical protein